LLRFKYLKFSSVQKPQTSVEPFLQSEPGESGTVQPYDVMTPDQNKSPQKCHINMYTYTDNLLTGMV